MRGLILAVLFLCGTSFAADAQVRVPIQAPVVVGPGDVLGGRRVVSTPVDPACLVTRGPYGEATALLFAPSRWGEHAAVMTPAFGRCARLQNPYPARIVLFDRVVMVGNQTVFRRGSLSCAVSQANPGSMLCNRPLRCDLSKARCPNP